MEIFFGKLYGNNEVCVVHTSTEGKHENNISFDGKKSKHGKSIWKKKFLKNMPDFRESFLVHFLNQRFNSNILNKTFVSNSAHCRQFLVTSSLKFEMLLSISHNQM